MAIYFFWGEDEFAMQRAIADLVKGAIDPAWESFNYEKIGSDRPDPVEDALGQILTPPFGAGKRLVWLADTALGQRCSEETLAQLERTFPKIPDSNVLLMTAKGKPDGRGKFSKLLQKQAEIREFSPISPWKTDELAQQVKRVAAQLGIAIAPAAVERLAAAVGNETRRLYGELEKLRLFVGDRAIAPADVDLLVCTTTQNSLELAKIILQGNAANALGAIAELISRNEAALRIHATLVGQFRTWLWIALMVEAGERDDRAIAQAAEIGNPKRIYFLKKELQGVSAATLEQCLEILLGLEVALKRGADPLEALQIKAIELCEVCRRSPQQTTGRR